MALGSPRDLLGGKEEEGEASSGSSPGTFQPPGSEACEGGELGPRRAQKSLSSKGRKTKEHKYGYNTWVSPTLA